MLNKTGKIILGAVAIILILLLGVAIGSKKGNTAKETTSATKVVQNNKATSSTDQNKDKKIYKVGEEGKSGAWSIKVLDTQETNTIAGGDGENKTTQQKFVVVHLQMTNKENNVAQYEPDNFLLGDIKTKAQYKMDMEAGETANQAKTIYAKDDSFFGVYDKVNPNLSKQTYIVFEVPTNFNIANAVLIHGGDDNKAVGYYLK
ncbi:FtsZ-interacting cell division protein ZipA [Clostridium acetobutylicum]|uniref:Uncharacterized secreted protein, homolog YXKC Bacillus subtilis n=1 Tax=Clostridium acetobutylicum (strain ATCC 824 / DSM 792 / JCM 1419 / IAM 19013 / LMG 5710 / NBRC 13948 / NRRL B-527 / VKM B-1787 / 2291 / W) TaxID=272562 RepID=Q97HY8_CLOAB|nr:MULTISPECIES: DUF4352 domain-containing protein [Clostridium]AAK79832.1 Uncharacterized secreted protein, homolog YXKC Bacillus subtilis [Clostridium acetobutylicum ATCC 824]ADZ20918.1 Conserved hypothetical protein [Clostridium acetobutylicum EA 2018]AEI32011.1 hypothetical protein SMB_G1893 [Clostridium acetobutylicum DSM 1731]AWV79738.1 DUF4352 domain-containing protein [Clostridium acetobutylicum]MBC2394284.1 DUF4352 domain-containing protein [Clostridium acetobutylicum]